MPRSDQKKQFKEICYSIYPEKITASVIRIGDDFMYFLERNRLNHYFALKYNSDLSLIADYNDYKKKITDSLIILKKNINPKNFLVIKTFSKYSHTTSDLDIVTKKQVIANKNKYLKLPYAYDINHQISWTNSEEISHEFIWRNTERSKFNNIEILIPNTNLDLLIRMAHLPFEQAEIRLGELLHIFAISRKVKWNVLQEEAKKNNWLKTFNRTKLFLSKLHIALFEKTNFINFPYRVSFLDLALAVIEKKAWNKIKGARYVFIDRLMR